MRIGITGTRHGINGVQQAAFERILTEIQPSHVHHGACKGADEQAAHLSTGGQRVLVAHPGQSAAGGDNEWLSQYALDISDEVRPTKSHFARNRDIVNETDALVALPGNMAPITPETKGGTAYTVNYARKAAKPLYIVRPDGDVERA